MDYANREAEHYAVKAFLERKANPIIIYAYHASGVTSFVKEKLKQDCISFFGENIYYIDSSTHKSLGEAIISKIAHSAGLGRLQKIADRKFGESHGSFLSSLLEGIPYVGPALGKLADKKNAIPVYSGVYASVLEELLIPFFRTTPDTQRYLIIIDSVEELSENSYNLLTTLILCKSIQFILVRTQENTQYDKLENYLYSHKVDTTCKVEFDLPQIKLIRELAALYDVSLTTNEAETILSNTRHNIHAIIREIRNSSSKSIYVPFSSWERAIISILNVWSGITQDILFETVVSCGVYADNLRDAFNKALLSLKQQAIVIQDCQQYVLARRHDPRVHAIISNIADQLISKNIVYDYITHNDVGRSWDELRYKISKELYCTTPTDARAYLRHLLLYGNPVPQEILIEANLEKGIYQDSILASIKYCGDRKYQEALEWIDSIPQEKKTVEIDCFRATLIDRVHRLSEAEEKILQCIKKTSSPSAHNILRAFLISTYIHMERLPDAREVYENGKDLYPDSPFHGYLVRNATSAYNEYKKELYNVALSDFRRDGDEFGYYTTLCNQGYALCKNGDLDSGKTILEEAKNGLELFPQSNLHIIYNDLGICYLLLGKHEDACRYFLLSQNLSMNTVPRVFSTINLACTEALMGRTEKALKRLDSIESEVENHKLDRVRQQYYVNRLLVEYLHGNKSLESYVVKASQYTDRYNPARTKQVVLFYKRFIVSKKSPKQQKWKDLYFPCGLVYWYMEPLKLLPAGII